MTTGKALGILLAVIVVVSTYLALAMWTGLHEYWAGFLFLTQWGLMEQAKVDRLTPSALGAVVGTGIALLPVLLTPLVGATPGLALTLAVILFSIYALIVGWYPIAINAAAMIFLTVVSIPHIVQGASPAGIYLGLTAGIVFFGGLALIAAVVSKARAAPAAGPSPAV